MQCTLRADLGLYEKETVPIYSGLGVQSPRSYHMVRSLVGHKFGEFIFSEYLAKVWQVNRSAKRLLLNWMI